jgi:hypothetical protein
MPIGDEVLKSGVKWGLPLRESIATLPAGSERREAERAISYWEDKVAALGNNATVAALDLAAINTPDWSNRFLITVDHEVEKSELLLCGPKFAELLHLSPKILPDRSFIRQLPRRYFDVFLRGCAATDNPLQVEGEIERDDDRIEQYRAAFIPVRVKPDSLTHCTFGAFNSRIVEPARAA